MLLKEDVDTAYDLSPLYRSTVGFDRLFDLLDQEGRVVPMTSWPPYDIAKIGEDQHRIVMAVAGFSPEEIELVQQGSTLTVSGRKHPDPEGAQILHRGIATRAFKQTFNLADYVKVRDAGLENGLLTIDLVREVPDEMKPRRIAISANSAPKSVGYSEPEQQAKAA
jgi:molecular chaperone IbpA